ncbi:MAG: LytTR family DNA-binding domain-containing protein [Clostridiaceae bacterium]|nr:LytTR family DNA-binding domain-containing protein [Clostridiaceae bacterium]
MKNVLILEDEEIESRMLRTIVEELQQDCCVYECASCEEAYSVAIEGMIHLFLADVRLKDEFDFSGFKFIQNIRQMDKYHEVPVIFISSLEGYELMAFRKMHCYDFITKPFNPAQVRDTIDKALRLRVIDQVDERIDFEINGIYYPVQASSIRYIEANRRIVYIHTISDILELPGKSLKDCYSLLNRQMFCQIHKSYIISRKYIQKVEKSNRVVYIEGDQREELPIGLKYVSELWEWLHVT